MNSRVTQAEACFLACCRGCKSEPRRVHHHRREPHLEDWTFMLVDGTRVHGRLDFRRVQEKARLRS